MAPSEGPGGDPAAGEGVTRSSRSDHRVRPTMRDRPAAAPTAGECDADGVEEEAVARRGCYPNGPTPAAGEGGSRWLDKRVVLEETSGKGAPAVPRCGLCRHPAGRRPRQFGEGTSAAGAEEAVLTCAQMGPAASCVPVASGGRGGGGGRGDRDAYIYGCTSRPHAFKIAPTSDLAPNDKATVEVECMEEGYLAKIVHGAKEIKVGEVICVIVEEGDLHKSKDYKPSAADAPAAPSESKATPEPPKASNEVQLSIVKGTGPDCRILKADIEDYLASVAKGVKCESSAASGLDYTDIPNAQIRKGFKNFSNSSKGLVQKIDNDYYTEGISQVFIYLCGSTISHQENLCTSNVNMLMKASCDKAGVKSKDFYSIFCGKVLDPEQLLSYYQIKKDSTIIINSRLRGGCAGDKTWDDIIRFQQHYAMVSLPPEDLVLLRPDGSAQQGPVLVKYLAALMQFRSRNVLIQLCRKHYSGTSYGGNITSKNILFDPDGNVRIDSAPEKFTQHSAKLDYKAIGKILDDSFKDKVYPMHFYHLVDFLRYGPAVDCQSEAVIAFVTNHYSLLSHYVRVTVSEILVQLIERLHPDVMTALLASLDKFAWANTVKNVAAMKHTYYYHSRSNQGRKAWVPYVDDGVSLLKFSNNFFKHHKWASLEQLDAAFSLMEKRNFIPLFLLTILVTLENTENQCPALIVFY